MSFSVRKSRIPSMSKSVTKSSFNAFTDLSTTINRYGSYSTARKSNNKPANYPSSLFKTSKGLFSQTPPVKRSKVGTLSSAAASGRRSSIIGDRSRQKDTRQLSDHNYQQTCTTKLIQFLTENHYPSQISTKFLKSPSKQDVFKVFEFLFSRIDPNVELTSDKLETRVMELMTQFGYPYYITKSSLVSFTGRQAIGNLLGMFEFLVDAAEYKQTLDSQEFSPSVIPDGNVKTSLLDALLEDSDEYAAFERLSSEIHGPFEDNRSLELEENKIDLDLQKIEEENDYAKSVPAQIMEFRKSSHEYITYITHMDDYIAKHKEISIQFKEEIARLRDEVVLYAEKLNLMQEKIDNQPFDIESVQLTRNRQRQFDEQINEDSKVTKANKLVIFSLSNEIAATKDQLTKKNDDYVTQFNSLLINVNTQSVKNYASWVLDKLHSCDLGNILQHLSSHSNNSQLRNQFFNQFASLNKLLIEVCVDLSAKHVQMINKDEQLNLAENTRRKELETLQKTLANAEQNLQLFKNSCQDETKFLNERFVELQKTVAEVESSLQKLKITLKSRADQLHDELSQQTNKKDENNKHYEVVRQKRRLLQQNLVTCVTESLVKMAEIEKKYLTNLQTELEAASAARGRMQKKVVA